MNNFDNESEGSTFVVLKWNPPSTNCSILSYILQATGKVLWQDKTKQNVSVEAMTISSNETSYNVSNLIPWTQYNFAIFATTDGGDGKVSKHDVTTLEDGKD